jgi:hypothetical protein
MDYLRYWDVLRVCCGKQMSGDYRDRLQRKHSAETGANNPSIKNYTPHRNESDGKPLSGTPFQVPRFLEPNSATTTPARYTTSTRLKKR